MTEERKLELIKLALKWLNATIRINHTILYHIEKIGDNSLTDEQYKLLKSLEYVKNKCKARYYAYEKYIYD